MAGRPPTTTRRRVAGRGPASSRHRIRCRRRARKHACEVRTSSRPNLHPGDRGIWPIVATSRWAGCARREGSRVSEAQALHEPPGGLRRGPGGPVVAERARLFAALAAIALPERCVVCGRFGAALHDACVVTLTRADGPRCPVCWQPGAPVRCERCGPGDGPSPALAVDGLRAAFVFEGAARRALIEAKFRGVSTLLPPLPRAAATVVRARGRRSPSCRYRSRARGDGGAASTRQRSRPRPSPRRSAGRWSAA